MRTPSQRAFRRRSGSVDSASPIAFLLYMVLRDYVPAGELESIVEDALSASLRKPHTFSNGWTAQHAIDAARRLYEAEERLRRSR
jgi:hypothetical protein